MKHSKSDLVAIISGALYALTVILLSRICIRYLGQIALYICGKLDVDEATARSVFLALDQLKNAAIHSPWLWSIGIGGVLGILFQRCIASKERRIVTAVILGLLLMIPLSLVCLWFTKVNTIIMGNVLQSIFTLLTRLL